jgi:hypothetical protein
MANFSGPSPIDKIVFGSGSADDLVPGRLPKAKTYKKYGNSDLVREALAFHVLAPGATLAAYSELNSKKVPLSTMRHLFLQCNFFEMQSNNTSIGEVEKVLTNHLKKRD